MGYVQESAEDRGSRIEDRGSRSNPQSSILDPQALASLFPEAESLDPLAAFLQHYQAKTRLNRQILDHLLHQTFQGEAGQAEPESDLLLDPNPDPEKIQAVLGRYPFRDVQAA